MKCTIVDVSMLTKVLYLLSAKIIRNHKHSLTVTPIFVHCMFRFFQLSRCHLQIAAKIQDYPPKKKSSETDEKMINNLGLEMERVTTRRS